MVDQFFGDLDSSDIVLEPSCGRGSFLTAIPQEIQAFGVEIDPNMYNTSKTGLVKRSSRHTPCVAVIPAFHAPEHSPAVLSSAVRVYFP